VAEHWLVWLVCPAWRLVGLQEALTEVMVGETGGVLPPPPPQPATHNEPSTYRANTVLRPINHLLTVQILLKEHLDYRSKSGTGYTAKKLSPLAHKCLHQQVLVSTLVRFKAIEKAAKSSDYLLLVAVISDLSKF
jgi:hypothetical protein